jgi:hypothetical protein
LAIRTVSASLAHRLALYLLDVAVFRSFNTSLLLGLFFLPTPFSLFLPCFDKFSSALSLVSLIFSAFISLSASLSLAHFSPGVAPVFSEYIVLLDNVTRVSIRISEHIKKIITCEKSSTSKW